LNRIVHMHEEVVALACPGGEPDSSPRRGLLGARTRGEGRDEIAVHLPPVVFQENGNRSPGP